MAKFRVFFSLHIFAKNFNVLDKCLLIRKNPPFFQQNFTGYLNNSLNGEKNAIFLYKTFATKNIQKFSVSDCPFSKYRKVVIII